MRTLGCALLFIGFSVVLAVLIGLVHGWLQAWRADDPQRVEQVRRLYEGSLWRFR
jgi:hypothetical protein